MRIDFSQIIECNKDGEREREETDRRRGMRAEIQVPEQEGVEHRSEMVRPPLLCFERESDLGIMGGNG